MIREKLQEIPITGSIYRSTNKIYIESAKKFKKTFCSTQK